MKHISRKYVAQLRTDVARWVAAATITQEQGDTILADYGDTFEQEMRAQRQGRIAKLIATLGALSVGLGVILWVGANWAELGNVVKLMMIIGSIVGVYGSAYVLLRRQYIGLAHALFFLGVLLYGAGIVLVAQMYHVRPTEGGLFFLWGIGALPLALFLRSQLLMVFTAAQFFVWFFMRNSAFADLGMLHDEILAYGLFGIGVLWYAYRMQWAALFCLQIIWSYVWLHITLGEYGMSDRGLPLFGLMYALGLLMSATVFVQKNAPLIFTRILAFMGLGVVAMITFMLSFHDVVEDMYLGGDRGLLVLALCGACASVLFTVHALLRKTFIPLIRAMSVGGAAVMMLFVVTMMQQTPEGVALFFLTLAWNVITVLIAVALIVLGHVAMKNTYVVCGLMLFLGLIFARYVDLAALFPSTYVTFIVGGLLLLGLGYVFERARRALARMPHTTVSYI